eukprot:tig00020553_g10738.t1
MSRAEPQLSARAKEGRAALATALAAARAWLEESEWHENARIEVLDGVRETWLSISRKEPGLGFVRVRPALFGAGRGEPAAEQQQLQQQDVPFDAFLDSDAARALYDADTYTWTCWKPKGPDGSRFLEPGDAVPAGFKAAGWAVSHEEVLARERSPAARADAGDQAEYEAIRKQLHEILAPVWQSVASGKRPASWKTGRSTDALTSFCEWLLLKGPLEKACFFLVGPPEEAIAEELDSGAHPSPEGYVARDGFLKGYASHGRPLEALELFRGRRAALALAAAPVHDDVAAGSS